VTGRRSNQLNYEAVSVFNRKECGVF